MSSEATIQNYMAINTSDTVPCPICKSISQWASAATGWGEWRRCGECTLEFVHPLRLGDDPMALFERAYQGQVQVSSMTEYWRRVDQRRTIISELNDPTLWFWTPAFYEVLNWVKSRAKSGGTVLELGCGLGFFLHALRKEGLQAVGLDVAQTAVELNRKDGFAVWHGPLESMPSDWVAPDAIASMFMLHHLEDPAAFLRLIRARWPSTPLAIAMYGPTDRTFASATPPRTLTKWNERALGTALRKAGYALTVQALSPTRFEGHFVEAVRSVLGRTMRLPQLYRLGKRIERIIVEKIPGSVRRDTRILVAFAEPSN